MYSTTVLLCIFQLVNADLSFGYSHKGYKRLKHQQLITTMQEYTDGRTESSIWLAAVSQILQEVMCV